MYLSCMAKLAERAMPPPGRPGSIDANCWPNAAEAELSNGPLAYSVPKVRSGAVEKGKQLPKER